SLQAAPVNLRALPSWSWEPAELAATLRDQPGFVFLDSSLTRKGAISILAWNPAEILEGRMPGTDRLDAALRQYSIESPDMGVPLGGLIGYVEFDGRYCFGVYPRLLVFRHEDRSWWRTGELPPLPSAPLRPRSPQIPAPLRFQPETEREAYLARIRRIQEYIAAGDIYQACLSHRWSSPFRGNAWDFYEHLRAASPAPHSAYLHFPGRRILSSSPELFLRMSDREIVTRPIKGTRPRFRQLEQDQRSAFQLQTSEKEVAELVMITDLERNDLGKICDYGSVQVADLLRLEAYEQVFHLVSTVRGRLRPALAHTRALAACFPGGSISGAPKKRALEIIRELETVPRGVYTGAIGYLGFNGESQFNIAIRTVTVENQTAHFHAGGGIVADSIPEKEWQETLDKAAGILAAAENFNRSLPRRKRASSAAD
ncbi:MAG TPA: aminodeoxychorismate synthase component I, partial [Chthoniobacterales bacterium]